MDSFRHDSQTTRLNRLHNSASTDRPRCAPKGMRAHAQPPGQRNRPRRSAYLPNRQHTCAQIFHPQTHIQQNPEKQADRGSQPRAHTHFQDTKNTYSPRKGPRARIPRPGHTPSPSSDLPTGEPRHITAARRRDRVHGTRTTSHTFPLAWGSSEDTPAPGSAPAMMEGLTDTRATSRVSSSRWD